MDLMKRSHAPIAPEAWKVIDEEARRVLKLNLAGRKLVDFSGPHGWQLASVSTGRLEMLPQEPVEGVSAGVRKVQPLIELRTPILLDIMELDSVARGAENPDLGPVVQAAERIARAEDLAIFGGNKAAGIVGIVEASPHKRITVGDATQFPRAVLEAKETLRQAGVNGPYALALGPRAYEELFAATVDGYPIAKRIERSIITGPVVRAPALDGAVVLSMRGGDYELTIGQDLAIGYADRSRGQVELFLTESFTFRVLEPGAAVALIHGSAAPAR